MEEGGGEGAGGEGQGAGGKGQEEGVIASLREVQSERYDCVGSDRVVGSAGGVRAWGDAGSCDRGPGTYRATPGAQGAGDDPRQL